MRSSVCITAPLCYVHIPGPVPWSRQTSCTTPLGLIGSPRLVIHYVQIIQFYEKYICTSLDTVLPGFRLSASCFRISRGADNHRLGTWSLEKLPHTTPDGYECLMCELRLTSPLHTNDPQVDERRCQTANKGFAGHPPMTQDYA